MVSQSKAVLPVLQAGDASFETEFEKLIDRRGSQSDDVGRAVRKIIEQVREGGDEALRACIRKFDGVKGLQLMLHDAETDSTDLSMPYAPTAVDEI